MAPPINLYAGPTPQEVAVWQLRQWRWVNDNELSDRHDRKQCCTPSYDFATDRYTASL